MRRVADLDGKALVSLLNRCAQVSTYDSVGVPVVFAAFRVGQRFHA